MKRSLASPRRGASFLLGLAIGFLTSPLLAVSSTVVISQVYGGGGNSGATLKNDFIELFNRGAVPVDVTGWSVQYASAAGTTWQTTALSGVIPSGGYYLVQEAQGAGGTVDLPTPDATGTIPMSATAGKIALVNTTTALTGSGCPFSASIVDFVGFGSTANCFEGTGPAPAPSNTTAVLRGAGGCTETDQNASDFATGPPAPRNSASATAACSGPTNPSGIGSANPNSAPVGGTTLLTVAVTPGGNPPSTGLAVAGDLTAIGGSAAQPFFDDGTNGDATAGDNTFSYFATVAGGTAPGPKTIPVTITDAQSRAGSVSIALLVEAPFTSIHVIQGSGTASPLAGQFVTTSGIVTGVKTNGVFVQTPDASADADPATSEGVFVFTSSTPPPAAAIGNLVQVSGTVLEFVPAADPASPPLTEIGMAPAISPVSAGNPLPAPILLTAADTSPTGSIEQLERFEGMRVSVASLTVSGPTLGGIVETTATATSNGVFYGVITGIPRPFREPGIQLPDPLPPGSPCCVPRFDANPERLRVDSDGLVGAAAIDVTAGAVVSGLVGPLDFAFRTYTVLPEPASPPSVSGNVTATPVRDPLPQEFTIATFNLNRFFDDVNDPAVSEPVIQPGAFANRLAKASLAIRNVLRTPDIIGMQEVEGLLALQALAARINADVIAAGGPDPLYQAYTEEGNDPGFIDVGLLVKTSRVDVLSVTQVGKTATYINPLNGLPELLNDRPPLLLEASVRRPLPAPGFLITVVVNHLRSLNGIEDPVDGARVRAKRKAQAEFLAVLIQGRRTANPAERIVSLGDYNAFQFNDGYVDVLGAIRGNPAPPDQVVLASGDLVQPDLINVMEKLPDLQRYSYVFDGSAQVLDHILINDALVPFYAGIAVARNNADFPETYRNDPARPERISDHDMPVIYFGLPPTGMSFYTVTPCRVADTRGNGFTGPYGPPALAEGSRDFPLAGQCGIPVSARAVAYNLTVVVPSGMTIVGHLTVHAGGTQLPPTSTINWTTPTTVHDIIRANNGIGTLGTNGSLRISYPGPAFGPVNVLLDVLGYFE